MEEKKTKKGRSRKTRGRKERQKRKQEETRGEEEVKREFKGGRNNREGRRKEGGKAGKSEGAGEERKEGGEEGREGGKDSRPSASTHTPRTRTCLFTFPRQDSHVCLQSPLKRSLIACSRPLVSMPSIYTVKAVNTSRHDTHVPPFTRTGEGVRRERKNDKREDS